MTISKEKSQVAVDKASSKATKDENKRLAAIVKAAITARVDAAKEEGLKDIAKAMAALNKDLATEIKAPF